MGKGKRRSKKKSGTGGQPITQVLVHDIVEKLRQNKLDSSFYEKINQTLFHFRREKEPELTIIDALKLLNQLACHRVHYYLLSDVLHQFKEPALGLIEQLKQRMVTLPAETADITELGEFIADGYLLYQIKSLWPDNVELNPLLATEIEFFTYRLLVLITEIISKAEDKISQFESVLITVRDFCPNPELQALAQTLLNINIPLPDNAEAFKLACWELRIWQRAIELGELYLEEDRGPVRFSEAIKAELTELGLTMINNQALTYQRARIVIYRACLVHMAKTSDADRCERLGAISAAILPTSPLPAAADSNQRCVSWAVESVEVLQAVAEGFPQIKVKLDEITQALSTNPNTVAQYLDELLAIFSELKGVARKNILEPLILPFMQAFNRSNPEDIDLENAQEIQLRKVIDTLIPEPINYYLDYELQLNRQRILRCCMPEAASPDARAMLRADDAYVVYQLEQLIDKAKTIWNELASNPLPAVFTDILEDYIHQQVAKLCDELPLSARNDFDRIRSYMLLLASQQLSEINTELATALKTTAHLLLPPSSFRSASVLNDLYVKWASAYEVNKLHELRQERGTRVAKLADHVALGSDSIRYLEGDDLQGHLREIRIEASKQCKENSSLVVFYQERFNRQYKKYQQRTDKNVSSAISGLLTDASFIRTGQTLEALHFIAEIGTDGISYPNSENWRARVIAELFKFTSQLHQLDSENPVHKKVLVSIYKSLVKFYRHMSELLKGKTDFGSKYQLYVFQSMTRHLAKRLDIDTKEQQAINKTTLASEQELLAQALNHISLSDMTDATLFCIGSSFYFMSQFGCKAIQVMAGIIADILKLDFSTIHENGAKVTFKLPENYYQSLEADVRFRLINFRLRCQANLAPVGNLYQAWQRFCQLLNDWQLKDIAPAIKARLKQMYFFNIWQKYKNDTDEDSQFLAARALSIANESLPELDSELSQSVIDLLEVWQLEDATQLSKDVAKQQKGLSLVKQDGPVPDLKRELLFRTSLQHSFAAEEEQANIERITVIEIELFLGKLETYNLDSSEQIDELYKQCLKFTMHLSSGSHAIDKDKVIAQYLAWLRNLVETKLDTSPPAELASFILGCLMDLHNLALSSAMLSQLKDICSHPRIQELVRKNLEDRHETPWALNYSSSQNIYLRITDDEGPDDLWFNLLTEKELINIYYSIKFTDSINFEDIENLYDVCFHPIPHYRTIALLLTINLLTRQLNGSNSTIIPSSMFLYAKILADSSNQLIQKYPDDSYYSELLQLVKQIEYSLKMQTKLSEADTEKLNEIDTVLSTLMPAIAWAHQAEPGISDVQELRHLKSNSPEVELSCDFVYYSLLARASLDYEGNRDGLIELANEVERIERDQTEGVASNSAAIVISGTLPEEVDVSDYSHLAMPLPDPKMSIGIVYLARECKKTDSIEPYKKAIHDLLKGSDLGSADGADVSSTISAAVLYSVGEFYDRVVGHARLSDYVVLSQQLRSLAQRSELLKNRLKPLAANLITQLEPYAQQSAEDIETQDFIDYAGLYHELSQLPGMFELDDARSAEHKIKSYLLLAKEAQTYYKLISKLRADFNFHDAFCLIDSLAKFVEVADVIESSRVYIIVGNLLVDEFLSQLTPQQYSLLKDIELKSFSKTIGGIAADYEGSDKKFILYLDHFEVLCLSFVDADIQRYINSIQEIANCARLVCSNPELQKPLYACALFEKLSYDYHSVLEIPDDARHFFQELSDLLSQFPSEAIDELSGRWFSRRRANIDAFLTKRGFAPTSTLAETDPVIIPDNVKDFVDALTHLNYVEARKLIVEMSEENQAVARRTARTQFIDDYIEPSCSETAMVKLSKEQIQEQSRVALRIFIRYSRLSLYDIADDQLIARRHYTAALDYLSLYSLNRVKNFFKHFDADTAKVSDFRVTRTLLNVLRDSHIEVGEFAASYVCFLEQIVKSSFSKGPSQIHLCELAGIVCVAKEEGIELDQYQTHIIALKEQLKQQLDTMRAQEITLDDFFQYIQNYFRHLYALKQLVTAFSEKFESADLDAGQLELQLKLVGERMLVYALAAYTSYSRADSCSEEQTKRHYLVCAMTLLNELIITDDRYLLLRTMTLYYHILQSILVYGDDVDKVVARANVDVLMLHAVRYMRFFNESEFSASIFDMMATFFAHVQSNAVPLTATTTSGFIVRDELIEMAAALSGKEQRSRSQFKVTSAYDKARSDYFTTIRDCYRAIGFDGVSLPPCLITPDTPEVSAKDLETYDAFAREVLAVPAPIMDDLPTDRMLSSALPDPAADAFIQFLADQVETDTVEHNLFQFSESTQALLGNIAAVEDFDSVTHNIDDYFTDDLLESEGEQARFEYVVVLFHVCAQDKYDPSIRNQYLQSISLERIRQCYSCCKQFIDSYQQHGVQATIKFSLCQAISAWLRENKPDIFVADSVRGFAPIKLPIVGLESYLKNPEALTNTDLAFAFGLMKQCVGGTNSLMFSLIAKQLRQDERDSLSMHEQQFLNAYLLTQTLVASREAVADFSLDARKISTWFVGGIDFVDGFTFHKRLMPLFRLHTITQMVIAYRAQLVDDIAKLHEGPTEPEARQAEIERLRGQYNGVIADLFVLAAGLRIDLPRLKGIPKQLANLWQQQYREQLKAHQLHKVLTEIDALLTGSLEEYISHDHISKLVKLLDKLNKHEESLVSNYDLARISLVLKRYQVVCKADLNLEVNLETEVTEEQWQPLAEYIRQLTFELALRVQFAQVLHKQNPPSLLVASAIEPNQARIVELQNLIAELEAKLAYWKQTPVQRALDLVTAAEARERETRESAARATDEVRTKLTEAMTVAASEHAVALTAITAERDALAKQVTDLVAENSQLTAEVARLKREHEAAKAGQSAADRKVTVLSQDLKTAQTDLLKEQKELAKRVKIIAAKEAELAQANAEHAVRVGELEARVQSLTGELDQAKTSVARSGTELEAERSRVVVLTGDLTDVRTKLESERSSVATLTAELAAVRTELETKIERFRSTETQLRAELEALRARPDSVELQERIVKLEQKVKELGGARYGWYCLSEQHAQNARYLSNEVQRLVITLRLRDATIAALQSSHAAAIASLTSASGSSHSSTDTSSDSSDFAIAGMFSPPLTYAARRSAARADKDSQALLSSAKEAYEDGLTTRSMYVSHPENKRLAKITADRFMDAQGLLAKYSPNGRSGGYDEQQSKVIIARVYLRALALWHYTEVICAGDPKARATEYQKTIEQVIGYSGRLSGSYSELYDVAIEHLRHNVDSSNAGKEPAPELPESLQPWISPAVAARAAAAH